MRVANMRVSVVGYQYIWDSYGIILLLWMTEYEKRWQGHYCKTEVVLMRLDAKNWMRKAKSKEKRSMGWIRLSLQNFSNFSVPSRTYWRKTIAHLIIVKNSDHDAWSRYAGTIHSLHERMFPRFRSSARGRGRRKVRRLLLTDIQSPTRRDQCMIRDQE